MSKRINVYIPNGEVYDDFKQMVKRKYGVYHTNIGLELQTAMLKELCDEGAPGYENVRSDLEKDQDIPDTDLVHTHKISKKHQKLIDYLYSSFTEDDFISKAIIVKFLVSECGLTTSATHKRYIDYLTVLKVLGESENGPKDEAISYFIIQSEMKKYVSPYVLVEDSL